MANFGGTAGVKLLPKDFVRIAENLNNSPGFEEGFGQGLF
jgi:hypothetical protein